MPDDADHVIEAEGKAHAYARKHGLSRPLYVVIRALARAGLRTWFRVRVSGTEYVPEAGGVIVASNHKNFLDPFFVGIATHRHVRFMAKAELFKGPLAWLSTRVGPFPIRRGESDREALDTARTRKRSSKDHRATHTHRMTFRGGKSCANFPVWKGTCLVPFLPAWRGSS